MWFVLLVALLALLKIFHERLCKILGGKHATGEQRRKAYPPAYPNNHPVIPHKLLRDDSFSGFDMTWHALDGMPSRPSGTRLFYQKISPKNVKTKVVLNLVHGLGSHTDGLMKNVAVLLANALDATIFMQDQYGNGRSDGLHGFIPSYQKVVEDQIYFVDKIVRPAAAAANVSVFAYGISLGGGLTAHACIQRPDLYDGAILECPAFAVDESSLPPWLVIKIVNILSWVIPAAPLIPSKLTLEKVVKDEECRAALERDTGLVYRGMRLGTGVQCLQLGFDLGANDWQLLKDKFVTPFLAIHGDKDQICSIKGSRLLVTHAATKDKTLHVVRDGLHALTAGEPADVVKGLLDLVKQWTRERQQ